MKAEAVIEAVVNAGGELAVAGDRIRYRLPKDYPGKQRILDELREHKPEIIRILDAIPLMPQGVRLIRWQPKPAPVVIDVCSVVVDVPKFIEAELRALNSRLNHPWTIRGGFTVPQILDRLAQAGLEMELTPKGGPQ